MDTSMNQSSAEPVTPKELCIKGPSIDTVINHFKQGSWIGVMVVLLAVASGISVIILFQKLKSYFWHR